MTTQQTFRAALAACTTLVAATAGAQLPNGSAAAAGMAGSFTAAARGADAATWNPANLGLPGNPTFSLRALSAGGVSGLDPVSWGDFVGYGDGTIPRDVRLQWVDRVAASGAQSGAVEGGATAVAFNVGRLGVHVGSVGYATASLSPDAVEALFFGNAGRTGQPRDLALAGSSLRAGAFATAAASYAHPLGEVAGGRAALGVTAKLVRGVASLRAQDAGSSVTASDIAVRFPVVVSHGTDAGSGTGVDVGAAWQGERVTLGARVENVVNTFRWDETALSFRAGSASFDGTTSSSDFDERPYADAPQPLRDAIAAERFAPAIGAGLAFRGAHALTVTADARHQLGGDDAIVIGPRTHVGVGVESRALTALPLRAGAAYVTGGWQAAAGLGLRLGAFEIAGAYTLRDAAAGRASGVMLNIVGVR
ncbi:hypothetical protein J421_2572 [Gemmatirosa kalamazoonensis]|uniref:DUF5723 domain-containing protein n=1 Tax=Gemmatirosa kalamazoonensis TaxID=861299 RepID=W0RG75_9BACT|nr:conjugal transfer protein TraF [Gemmatirosa kalamazoonensis]AHG90109.1 hypothetical protein J421_2572 [Gemmatirosa kalamazoonensis]